MRRISDSNVLCSDHNIIAVSAALVQCLMHLRFKFDHQSG